ncbi:hypothetical protein GOBAR_DD20615 [Gossypium barbadense]|nr:hypothetical protein GOBAR_DD20615 [Gossypium barbadense]
MRFSRALKVAPILLLLLILFHICECQEVSRCDPATDRSQGISLNVFKRYFHKPKSCEFQAHKGDRIKVHYRGKLTDGTVFDSSFERGDPIEFELGSGQVIKGWDQGLLGMCVGEKRKLKIPAKLGYGDHGSPPKIPGGATLVFDTELVAVNGKPSSGGDNTSEDEL